MLAISIRCVDFNGSSLTLIGDGRHIIGCDHILGRRLSGFDLCNRDGIVQNALHLALLLTLSNLNKLVVCGQSVWPGRLCEIEEASGETKGLGVLRLGELVENAAEGVLLFLFLDVVALAFLWLLAFSWR